MRTSINNTTIDDAAAMGTRPIWNRIFTIMEATAPRYATMIYVLDVFDRNGLKNVFSALRELNDTY